MNITASVIGGVVFVLVLVVVLWILWPLIEGFRSQLTESTSARAPTRKHFLCVECSRALCPACVVAGRQSRRLVNLNAGILHCQDCGYTEHV
jgi:hypothetical protein